MRMNIILPFLLHCIVFASANYGYAHKPFYHHQSDYVDHSYSVNQPKGETCIDLFCKNISN